MSFILFSKILLYTSIVIWLIPPIRQYGNVFFSFFLILALLDPIALLFRYLFLSTIPFEFYIFANFLLLISIVDRSKIKSNVFFFIAIGFFLLVIILFANFSNNQSIIILLSFQFLILSVVLKKFIVNYAFDKSINVFQLMLIFYFLTNITKFFNVLTGFADATAFFIITTIAQIIFGLYFSIVRENKPQVVL